MFYIDTIKERVKKNKKKDAAQEEFFEDAPTTEEHTSFYQMNLSRPLLKVVIIFYDYYSLHVYTYYVLFLLLKC